MNEWIDTQCIDESTSTYVFLRIDIDILFLRVVWNLLADCPKCKNMCSIRGQHDVLIEARLALTEFMINTWIRLSIHNRQWYFGTVCSGTSFSLRSCCFLIFLLIFSIFSKSNHSCILYRPQLTEINLRFVSIVGEECEVSGVMNFRAICCIWVLPILRQPVWSLSNLVQPFFLHGLDALTKATNLVCATSHLNEDIAATEDDIRKFAKKRKFSTKVVFLFWMGCRPSVLSLARGMMVAMEEPLRGGSGFNPA